MTAPPPAAKKQSTNDRLRGFFEKYGPVGIGTFAVVAVLNFAGVYLAMKFGWQPETVVGQGATVGAAYVVYKLMMPVRFPVALLLTPVVVKVVERIKGTPRLPRSG